MAEEGKKERASLTSVLVGLPEPFRKNVLAAAGRRKIPIRVFAVAISERIEKQTAEMFGADYNPIDLLDEDDGK